MKNRIMKGDLVKVLNQSPTWEDAARFVNTWVATERIGNVWLITRTTDDFQSLYPRDMIEKV